MAYYSKFGTRTMTTNISSGVTVVDCQKQVRSWRLLRCVVETLIPCCNGFNDDHDDDRFNYRIAKQPFYYPQPSSSSTTVIGTIFGPRKGKVSLCIQTTPSKHTRNPSSTLLLIELAVSTQTLAREMRGGFLRIALESRGTSTNYSNSSGSDDDDNNNDENDDLLSTPVWKMYCNGRRVGYAVKRRPTETDTEALRLMGSAGASGAGVIRGKELKLREDCDDNDDHDDDGGGGDDEIMYMRAKFERVCGSTSSESFHLIDPDRGCVGQELSVFFYRSTS